MPTILYQQYEPQGEQTQPRSFSVSRASSIHAAPIASQLSPQWRSGREYYYNLDTAWQQQQYPSMQERPTQTGNINTSNIVGEVGDVLQRFSSNDAPYFPGSSQQHPQQQFNGEQFRLHASGAATTIPEAHETFTDSGFYSQTSQKRPAPSNVLYPDVSDHFLPTLHGFTTTRRGSRSPKSTVSDSQLHKKPKRSQGKLIICPRDGCGKIDLKNDSDLK